MASRLEVIRSNKGHHKVIHLGFMYTKHKAMGDKIRWRCVQRGAHCKGSIFTSNDFREPRVTVNHNHMPDFNAVEFARSRTMFAERLALFHPLEVVELNRETSRVNATRLKQEPQRGGNAGRVKQEPMDSNGYYCPSLDMPSTSSAECYAPNAFTSSRPTRKSQAPQPPPAPAKPVQPPPQQQPPQLKRPMMMKPLAPKPRPASPPQPPPPPPEVCLRWNSYHSNMQATFPALLNNEQFVDVTLACEGRSIKCHKMILSACSSYFDELLSQNPCQHPIVLMKDLKFWEVQALVEFMYRGEVNVSQDKLPFLLAAAEALQIKGLASPTSSTPQHDDDSMSLGMDSDYLDDLEIPSPTSARRSRKRRTIAAIPVHTTPPPAAAPVVRSARLQRNNNHHAIAQPSTSGYMPLVQEPPTRKRKLEAPEMEVNDHVMREIKLEPVDIDASSDSMDHSAELFQLTCEPTPAFHAANDLDNQRDTMRGNAADERHDSAVKDATPGDISAGEADEPRGVVASSVKTCEDEPNGETEPTTTDTTERTGNDTTMHTELDTAQEMANDSSPSEANDTVLDIKPDVENEPHRLAQVSEHNADNESPSEETADTVFEPGDTSAHEEKVDATPVSPPCPDDD